MKTSLQHTDSLGELFILNKFEPTLKLFFSVTKIVYMSLLFVIFILYYATHYEQYPITFSMRIFHIQI
ncbi:unnamed protein product [Adineta ricciae]|uniref:Uncharacterized protein n=1 Tax=Adineta ricciae TaxID=249248 RepID=A0A815MWV9_ADIRI|nr:unnamed protein product [Adineta ricciae]